MSRILEIRSDSVNRLLTLATSLSIVYLHTDKGNTMNIIDLARMTEVEARQYMETILWPNGPICPHCQSTDATRLNGKAHRAGVFQCNQCREQYTVTVGSVMESSKIPLIKWAMAFHLICSSKKGFSALQLKRELQLGSYKTAWFMLHRIRLAMAPGGEQPKLKGVVEADETYVGARKPRVKGSSKKGRGTSKQPVMVLVERDGGARCKPLERVTGKMLKQEIDVHVARESILVTDEFQVYNKLGKQFAAHEKVNHGRKEYSRKLESGFDVHNNTAESFNALLKRGHYGVYHQFSKKHLFRYCDEFTFRWNHRKATDSQRTESAIAGVTGKRLVYQNPDTKTAG